MKKRYYVGVLCLAAGLALTACGGQEAGNRSGESIVSEESSQESASVFEDVVQMSSSDENNAEEESAEEVDELAAYRETAKKILGKTEELFRALKAGDVAKVVELGYPEDDITKSLANAVDSEKAKQIMQTVYADLCYEIREQDIEYLAGQLYELADENYDEDEEGSLSLECFAYRWMLNFKLTALDYFADGVIVPKNFKPASEEEAFAILNHALSKTPLTFMHSINITVPDKEGNFYFLYEDDNLFEDAGMEYLGRAYEEEMAAYYVSKLMDVISDYQIGDTTAIYESNNDLYVEATRLAKEKRFEEITDLLENSDVAECDFREQLGSYADLNDAQKAFVDEYVTKIEVVVTDYSWVPANGIKERAGGINLLSPELEFFGKPLEAFAEEHKIQNSSSYFYYSSSSPKTLDGALLYDYYCAIRYAKDTIQ